MTERAPAGVDRPTLPLDTERCGGFITEAGHERCPRRFRCARFLAATGAVAPFRIAACEGRADDAFMPVSHGPHDASPREQGESLASHSETNETQGVA